MRKKTSFVSSSLSVVPAPSSFACGLSLRATDNGPRTKDQQDKGRLFRIHYIHYSPFIIHPAPPPFRPTTSPFATPLLDQEGARGWLPARPAPGLRSGARRSSPLALQRSVHAAR